MVMFPGFMAGMDVTVGLVGDGPDQVDWDGGGGVVQAFTLTREVIVVLNKFSMNGEMITKRLDLFMVC